MELYNFDILRSCDKIFVIFIIDKFSLPLPKTNPSSNVCRRHNILLGFFFPPTLSELEFPECVYVFLDRQSSRAKPCCRSVERKVLFSSRHVHFTLILTFEANISIWHGEETYLFLSSIQNTICVSGRTNADTQLNKVSGVSPFSTIESHVFKLKFSGKAGERRFWYRVGV